MWYQINARENFYFCSFAKITVAKFLKIRYSQKLLSQKLSYFCLYSQKLVSQKNIVAMINVFRVVYCCNVFDWFIEPTPISITNMSMPTWVYELTHSWCQWKIDKEARTQKKYIVRLLCKLLIRIWKQNFTKFWRNMNIDRTNSDP